MRSVCGATGDRVVVREVREVREQGLHRGREAGHFVEVQLGERFDAACAVLGERETTGAPVVRVASALDESRGFRAVDEPDRAVVLEQEVAGDRAD